MTDLYPHTPGFKVSGPSAEAAAAVAPLAGALRAKVLAEIQIAPATADEVATKLDHSLLGIRPRVSELRRMGLIAPTGERRRNASGLNASVWSAVSEEAAS